MSERNDLESINRVGLSVIYTKAASLKRKAAVEGCNKILEQIDNWESRYSNAKRCFDRSGYYGQWIIDADLSEEDKMAFFWKTLANAIKDNSKDFQEAFPEKYHSFNKENFEKLCVWLDGKRWSITSAVSQHGTDAETVIMSALKNGEGDGYGF